MQGRPQQKVLVGEMPIAFEGMHAKRINQIVAALGKQAQITENSVPESRHVSSRKTVGTTAPQVSTHKKQKNNVSSAEVYLLPVIR